MLCYECQHLRSAHAHESRWQWGGLPYFVSWWSISCLTFASQLLGPAWDFCETELDGEEWKERYGKSKFSKWEKFGRNPEGHIVFQDHGDKVWYRNITVKRLPENKK